MPSFALTPLYTSCFWAKASPFPSRIPQPDAPRHNHPERQPLRPSRTCSTTFIKFRQCQSHHHHHHHLASPLRFRPTPHFHSLSQIRRKALPPPSSPFARFSHAHHILEDPDAPGAPGVGASAASALLVSCTASLTMAMTLLNSGRPASPTTSYSQLSLEVTTTPSARRRASASGTSSRLQLLTPSASTQTRWPARRASSAVCVMQMWLSMPTRTMSSSCCAGGGEVEDEEEVEDEDEDEEEGSWETSAGIHMLKRVLSAVARQRGPASCAASSGTVSPRRARFCVVA